MKRDVLSGSSNHRLAAMALSPAGPFPWQSDCGTGKPVPSDIGSIGLLPAQLAGVGRREGGQVERGVVVAIEHDTARHADERPLGHGMTQNDTNPSAASDPYGKTKSGREVTEADIERWVAEAERGYDPARLRPKTRIASWAEILVALDAYLACYEVGDVSLSPWPDDPDGGELRLIGALRKIVELAAQTDQTDQMMLSTVALRLLISSELEGRP